MAAKGKLCSVFQKMLSHFLWDLFLSKKEFSSIVCGGCSDLAASGLVGGAAPTDIGHLPSHSLPPTEVRGKSPTSAAPMDIEHLPSRSLPPTEGRGKSPTSTAPTDIGHLPSFPITKVSLQLVFNSSSNLHGSGLPLPTPSKWDESPIITCSILTLTPIRLTFGPFYGIHQVVRVVIKGAGGLSLEGDASISYSIGMFLRNCCL